MKKPTLVILAAGMGRRYGGMKQLETVGPGGATLMDYSVYDALRSGFGKVVFVIRPEMEQATRETLGRRYEQHIAVEYAFQRLEGLPGGYTVPPGRTKPWGTGQALLAAAGVLREPLAVVNADDFYGADSFAALGEFLRTEFPAPPQTFAMVGFPLRETLSEAGSVNRGVCRCSADGWLESIEEIVGIVPDGTGARYTSRAGEQRVLSGDEPVSMNTWGFPPAAFGLIEARLTAFLAEHGKSTEAEFYLPTAVQELMTAGQVRVRVLPTRDRWCGITNPADRARVEAFIRERVAAGVYPEKLWQ